MDFAGKRQAFTSVAGPPETKLGPGVFTNYPLSPLIPYRGGVVELSAGLVALEGDNRLRVMLDVLGGFSSLIGPPLSAAVGVATQLDDGIGKLVGAGGDVVLGVHDGYVAPNNGAIGNILRPGYLAVVRADARVFDGRALRVVNSRLTYNGNPLDGYDYLLFQIESRQERDSWFFPDLEALLNETKRKVALGDQSGVDALRKQLLATIVTSSDLTEPDRWRVATIVKQQLNKVEAHALGAVSGPAASLEAALNSGVMDIDVAKAMPAISLDALQNS
jgi:hypothetical protein